MKKIFVLGFVFAIISLQTAFAGQWVDDGGWWSYYDDDGDAVSTGFHNIDGVNYYFDENFHMATGLVNTDKGYYYFNDDGTPRKEPVVISKAESSYIINVHEVGATGKVSKLAKADYEAYTLNVNEFGGTELRKQAVETAKKIMSVAPVSRQTLYYLLRCDRNQVKDNSANKALAEEMIKSGVADIVLVAGVIDEKFPVFEAEYGVNNCGANWKEVCEKEALFYLSKGYDVDRIRKILSAGEYTVDEYNYVINNILNTTGDKAGQMASASMQTEEQILADTVETTTNVVINEPKKGAAVTTNGLVPNITPIENSGVLRAGVNDTAGYTQDQQNSIAAAKAMLETNPCSKKKLIILLEASGLTHQQAIDGASFVNVDWINIARKAATKYAENNYTLNAISNLLYLDDFSDKQCEEGVEEARRYKANKKKELIKIMIDSGVTKDQIIATSIDEDFNETEIEELYVQLNTFKALPSMN